MTLQDQQRALEKARFGKLAHHGGIGVSGARSQPQNTATGATSPHQQHGDRNSGDDDGGPRGHQLPVFVRFSDLVAAGIVANWTTLLRLIETEDFPPGILIGPNTRAWRVDEIEGWLDARPSAKKVLPPGAIQPRGRKRITKHD